MSSWAASKFTPGKFLGSTGANILSVKELEGRGSKAWARKVRDGRVIVRFADISERDVNWKSIFEMDMHMINIGNNRESDPI